MLTQNRLLAAGLAALLAACQAPAPAPAEAPAAAPAEEAPAPAPEAKAPAGPDSSEERRNKVLANLKFAIPQIEEGNGTIGMFQASGVDGLDRGVLNLGGRPIPFLVTSDDTKLWLIQGDALDVSRNQAEIEVELAKRAEAARQEAIARNAKIEASVEGRPFRGAEDASVLIVEFSDFQCPYCSRGADTVEQILAAYPDDVKFVFQHFPLGFHPWAKPAAIAANCAGNQDPETFWILHDKYFEDQRELTPDNVFARSKGYLEGSEIDMEAWETCAGDETSEEYQAESKKVDADMAFGQEMGVSGTPGFFVNGEFLNGAQPITAFVPLIEAAKTADGTDAAADS